MKTCFVIVILFLASKAARSQGVLIGDGVPVPQAMLEVRSASKGLLIPRMSQVQRLSIQSPVGGLMTYDTTTKQLYRYNGSNWRYLLDDSFWKKNGENVYNLEDSIGIGTSSPDEKLQVTGDVNLNHGHLTLTGSGGAARKFYFDYTGSATNGYTQSINFSVGDTRLGFLQYRKSDSGTEDQLTLGFDQPALTLQTNGTTYLHTVSSIVLQSGLTTKGFAQLSGNDLRLGTNTSNSTGRFVVRTNGADRWILDEDGRVGIGAPSAVARLQVSGNFRGSTNLFATGTVSAGDVVIATDLNKSTASGFYNLLPAFYGKVKGSTAVCDCSASSLSVWGIGSGNYFISYPGLTENDIIIVKPNHTGMYATTSFEVGYNRYRVLIFNNSFQQGGVENGDFSFIIYKP